MKTCASGAAIASKRSTSTTKPRHVSRCAALEHQTRDQMVAKLLAMLDREQEEAALIATLESLGALQAVEALPKLITMLDGSKGDVRAAIQSALDRINSEK